MSKDSVRLYSATDPREGVHLRQLSSRDLETDSDRNVPAEVGRWVVDANYDGRCKTTVDLQDLVRYIETIEPGLIQSLIETNVLSSKEAFEEIRKLNTRVQAIVEAAYKAAQGDGDSFVIAFSHIFNPSVSHRVSQLCEISGARFDWYDPDSSYQEDVCAYASALQRFVDDQAAYFDALPQ